MVSAVTSSHWQLSSPRGGETLHVVHHAPAKTVTHRIHAMQILVVPVHSKNFNALSIQSCLAQRIVQSILQCILACSTHMAADH